MFTLNTDFKVIVIMAKLDIPKMEPINVTQYEFKQAPYPQADRLRQ